jgi:hypothetical protein
MSFTNDLKGYADAAVETGRSVINDGIAQGRTAVNEGLTQGRTAVNERITALRSTVDGGIDGAGDRAGKFAETATGVGTQALDRVRSDVVAAVGALDAAVTGLVTRLQEFPNDVVGSFAKVQNGATDAADKLQGRFQTVLGQSVGTAQTTVADVRSGAIIGKTRESAEAYRKQVEQTYAARRADLHTRGEAVVTELRKDPRVARVASLVGVAAETVEDVAAKPARRRSAEQAQATRAHNERSARAKKAASTRARKTAAPAKATKKTAAKKATKATS